jgi:hypothetical protein
MGKVTIYISLVDGKLMYRDSEKDHGKTIQTSVDPGDTVIWKLDKCSGIKELKKIEILSGPKYFFGKQPKKQDFNEWKAEVSDLATGGITYKPEYSVCEELMVTKSVKAGKESEPKAEDPPAISVRP